MSNVLGERDQIGLCGEMFGANGLQNDAGFKEVRHDPVVSCHNTSTLYEAGYGTV